MRNTGSYQKRPSTTEAINKEPQQDRLEWQSCSIVKVHTPRWATHKWENNYNCRSSPQGARGLSPTLCSPAWGSCTSRQSSQNVWLWWPMRLTFGRPRELWEIETPLLNGSQNITCSGTQGRSSDLKVAWVRPTCRSWASPREAGGKWDSPWGHRHWWQPFLSALLTGGHWC